MKNIPRIIIDEAMSYAAYRELIDRRFVDGETTGTDHSEAMLNYTHLNISRMRRLDKTVRLTEDTLDQIDPLTARRIILQHPKEYILFGTDSPWSGARDTYKHLQALGLGTEREELILSENGLALLNSV